MPGDRLWSGDEREKYQHSRDVSHAMILNSLSLRRTE
jgi:hypothetical protein